MFLFKIEDYFIWINIVLDKKNMGVSRLKKAGLGSSLQVRQPHNASLCGLSIPILNANLQPIFASSLLQNHIESNP